MDHAEVLDRLEAAVLAHGGVAALGSDPSDEATELRAHLAGCMACEAEHRAWRLTGRVLAENVPDSLTAPPAARERTLAAVAATGAHRPLGSVSVMAVAPLPPPDRPRSTTPRPTFLALAAAFAAAVFLAGAVLAGPLGLVPQAPSGGTTSGGQSAAVASAVDRVLQAPDHKMVPLMDAAGAKGGSLLFDPASRELVVISRPLEPLPEGSEYGCYLERDGERTRVGRLRVADEAAYWMGPMAGPPDAGRDGDRFVVVRDDRPTTPVLSGGF